MSYQEARAAAESCTTFEEVDQLLKRIECEFDAIKDGRYYALKRIALDAVIENN